MKKSLKRKFGENFSQQSVSLSHLQDWTGDVLVVAMVERGGVEIALEGSDMKADFYRLYAKKRDGALQLINDFGTEKVALEVAKGMSEIYGMLSNKYFDSYYECFQRIFSRSDC